MTATNGRAGTGTRAAHGTATKATTSRGKATGARRTKTAAPAGGRTAAATNASRSRATKKPASARRQSGAAAGSRAKTGSRAKPAANRRQAMTGNGTANGKAASGSVTETIVNAANKARRPAVALGAVAAGVAGGLALRNHGRRRTVLGVSVPRGLTIDAKAVAKSVGHASQQFAKTSKSVSKDIERAGEQAERIGKILS